MKGWSFQEKILELWKFNEGGKKKQVNLFLTPYKKLLTQKQTIEQNTIPRIIKLSGENIITFGKLSWIQYEKHDPQEWNWKIGLNQN